MNTSPHLNRAKCKAFLLEYANNGHKHHKMKRVADKAFETLDFKLRELMRNLVDSQPSKGVTIR
jgi:hypothetical protein